MAPVSLGLGGRVAVALAAEETAGAVAVLEAKEESLVAEEVIAA